MRALARGSDGLAEIWEADLALVMMPLISDQLERKTLQPYVESLLNGAATLKATVQDMITKKNLSLPVPQPRPHHSVLV